MFKKDKFIGKDDLNKKIARLQTWVGITFLVIVVVYGFYAFFVYEPYIPPEPEVTKQLQSVLHQQDSLYSAAKPLVNSLNPIMKDEDRSKFNRLIKSINEKTSLELPYYKAGQDFIKYDSMVNKLIAARKWKHRRDTIIYDASYVSSDPFERTFRILTLFFVFFTLGLKYCLLSIRSFLMGYHGIEDPVEGPEET